VELSGYGALHLGRASLLIGASVTHPFLSQTRELLGSHWWALVAIVAAAVVGARLVGIDYNYDSDEIFSVTMASDTWGHVIARSLGDKPHPPLHNVLLHFWVRAFGTSEPSARALSVLCSLGAVLFFLAIVRVRTSALLALGAGLTVAFSGFLVYYGQQARPYALISLIGVANLWAFMRVLEAPDQRARAWIWAATAPLMMYAQYLGALYLFVEGCVLLARLPLRSAIRVLIPAALGGATIVPWMWQAFHASSRLAELGWIERPAARSLPDFYVGVVGWPPGVSGWILLACVAAVLVAAGIRWWRSPRLPPGTGVLLVIALVPPLIAVGLSYLLDISVWAPRQLITSAFAFIAFLAVLVDSLPAYARAIAVGGLVVWAAAGMVDGFPSQGKPPWREIMARIEREDARAMVLGQEFWTVYPLQHYARGALVRQFDAESARPTSSSGVFYFVCRPLRCTVRASLEKQWGSPTEFARDAWNAAGGKPRDVVVTYRFTLPRSVLNEVARR
jgi:hypothetical protein